MHTFIITHKRLHFAGMIRIWPVKDKHLHAEKHSTPNEHAQLATTDAAENNQKKEPEKLLFLITSGFVTLNCRSSDLPTDLTNSRWLNHSWNRRNNYRHVVSDCHSYSTA